MPPAAVKAVAAIRAQREADFRAAALDCANECARACADTLHTALAFAPKPRPEPPPPPSSVNLVFNPSFEEDDGDGVPDGWCVGWLDLEDRVGRAERYRAGTHWDKPVRTGQFSALILWPPQKGLEWRQTWRRALRVRPGEKYRVAAWVKTRAAAGLNCVALEFYDAAYQPISRATSESATADDAWRLESVEVSVPEKARWARVILHSESSDGAVWFDDVEVVNLR
ncbi:MAG: hypothetical protein FJ278_25360 [Planctomycetes bacterium]|nr:hypothetical protein [Planctomycetota bacterium]